MSLASRRYTRLTDPARPSAKSVENCAFQRRVALDVMYIT